LLLLNRGFYHFHFGHQLIEQKINFITRLKKGTALQVEQVFTDGYALRDKKERLGSGTKTTRFITLRLIEVRWGKTWHSYLTSVLDQKVLPQKCGCRPLWATLAIEEAFYTVKSLLGLSYLWTGSLNGVKLQIWEGYFMLMIVDLGNAVADELYVPFDQIS
jgi:hypothetical protein